LMPDHPRIRAIESGASTTMVGAPEREAPNPH